MVLGLDVSITMASASHTTTRPPDATTTIILTRRLTRPPTIRKLTTYETLIINNLGRLMNNIICLR